MPLKRQVYPWFMLFRVIMTLGYYIGFIVPLHVDYVQTEYIGRA